MASMKPAIPSGTRWAWLAVNDSLKADEWIVVEVIAPLLDRMREVMDLGVVRLLVEVFQQDQRALVLGVGDDALQAFAPGLHALRLVRSEMEARRA